MKRFTTMLAAAMLVAWPLIAQQNVRSGAQLQAISKYPQLPDFAWEMMLDRVGSMKSHVIMSQWGAYVGQTDNNHLLSGFGYYIGNDGNQRIGLFFGGAFAYGITMTQAGALVGTPNEYACYSLTDASLEYVNTSLGQFPPSKLLEKHQFVSITYPNQDRYVGEMVDGKQHGLGLYYYSNGDFWFGQYKNGVRDGCGCMFCNNNMMLVGQWSGDDERRVIMLKYE